MNAKTYQRFLQLGAIASLIVVFFVFSNLLFPFITSKQLVFNILTEFLLIIWLVFIWKFPAYRPKKSLITYGLIAFLLAITYSCFVSVDPINSFWGNAERMLGVFDIIHFFFLYLVLVSVFRDYKDWQILFLTSVSIATIISLLGIFGNPYSQIGNTAYVSGYLIFNIYFAALVFYRNRRADWRWWLLLPVFIMLLEFGRAHTSGAIIGLGISVLAIIFMVGALHRNKKIKITSWSVLAALVIALALLFSQQHAAWFENSFLKNLTAQKATFQTRLVSWEAAAKDFHNHPWFGVGLNNYAVVFDRYFNARFYNYSKSETYFDRAHNNLIDIASTTGIVGLLAYLSIFVAVGIYLSRLIKKNRHDFEPVILIGLFVAYFIQNLAVFDSLVTYTGLMISLAYIYYLINPQTEADKEKKMPEFTALIIGIIIFVLFTNSTNLRAWQTFSQTIDAYQMLEQGEVMPAIEAYQAAFKIPTPLDRDAKKALINGAISSQKVFTSLSEADKEKAMAYLISIAQDNVSHNPQDSLMQLQLSQIYSLALNNVANKDLKEEYYNGALAAINASLAVSPQRVPVYVMKSNILLTDKDYDQAIEAATTAIEFNSNLPDAYCQLYRAYQLKANQLTTDKKAAGLIKVAETKAWSNGDKCVDLKGVENLGMTDNFVALLNHYYNAKDWTRTLTMAQQLTVFQSNNPDAWRFLAEIYGRTGDVIDQQAALQKATVAGNQTPTE
jgi:O-antigen ligase